MRKLPPPFLSMGEMIEVCKAGIGVDVFKDHLDLVANDLEELGDSYAEIASAGELYRLSPLPRSSLGDEIVAFGISKQQFINLYSYYLRHPGKPGRGVYDRLFLAADEKCPFCGGIGRPRNLDHFMPKASFPQFSVIPSNLVPSCRDCNMDGKGERFSSTKEGQVIHPYLDQDCFFNQQWISARIASEEPCSLEFFVNPPNDWLEVDRERARTHFNEFAIARRYSVVAGEELATVISQRKGYLKSYNSEDFRLYLESFLDAPYFMNHWKRVMYKCLSSDVWFCENEFQ